MKKQKAYIGLTLIISILFGIILLLSLGAGDFTLIALLFTFAWFVYVAGLLLSTFLVKPGVRIKVIQRKNSTIVEYELRDSDRERANTG